MTRIVFCISILLVMCERQAFAISSLVDWLFYDNRYIYEAESNDVGSMPDYFYLDRFDWETGQGTIRIICTLKGDYSFISFFDHEFSEGQNSYYNEYGETVGSPELGQSWEIDEPGYAFGDIYDNSWTGNLDDSNAIPFGSEDDVSMALGWEFSLLTNKTAVITFTLSEFLPTGFYLAQNDPDGTLYFSSTLTILSETNPAPEPSSMVLWGVGIISIFAFRSGIYNKLVFSVEYINTHPHSQAL